MTLSKALINALLERIRNNLPAGIKAADVVCLPEGRVPATVGQRMIVVHPHRMTTLNPHEGFRMRRIEFDISVIRRIRDIPADRFDVIYTQDDEMANTHEVLLPLIESIAFLSEIVTLLPTYSVTRNFAHLNTNLDPIHLYPGGHSALSLPRWPTPTPHAPSPGLHGGG